MQKGTIIEYVGSKSKITMGCNNLGLRTVQFTQPVLISKFWEEDGPMEGPSLQVLAVAGQVLIKGDGNRTVSDIIA